MARNNFQYEKRQRELEKKRKAEEKARRKLDAKGGAAEGEAMHATVDADAGGVATPEGDADPDAAAPARLA